MLFTSSFSMDDFATLLTFISSVSTMTEPLYYNWSAKVLKVVMIINLGIILRIQAINRK